MDKIKLQEQYKALDKLHTKYVLNKDWNKVSETFGLMMQVSDRLYGGGRDA